MLGVEEASAHDLGARLRKLVPPNPKQRPASDALWFDYYAGYANDFVESVLVALKGDVTTVLDPWNGAGTTTAMAARHNLGAVGLDVNPAAVVIAKARLLRSDVLESLEPLVDDILRHAARRRDRSLEGDLLLRWLTPATAARFRRIERSVAQLLVPSSSGRGEASPLSTARLSALGALFYLALFRTARRLLRPFFASNRTWIRLKVEDDKRLDIDFSTLAQCFREAMTDLGVAVAANTHSAPTVSPRIRLADSLKIPLGPKSVDAIVTSPPYCTRIDYAIATLPELAVLGFAWTDVERLRSRLIGTPTMLVGSHVQARGGSPRLGRLLGQIDKHDSYAARSYYLPFFQQYFLGMRRSLKELYRVARPGAPLVLVVQDSWFKDIHVETPAILNELSTAVGWNLLAEHHFNVRTRAAIHPHRTTHMTSQAIETVTLLVR
jgi:hypothetical protein